jgi:tetratricopeptide (TPR) repeat protein
VSSRLSTRGDSAGPLKERITLSREIGKRRHRGRGVGISAGATALVRVLWGFSFTGEHRRQVPALMLVLAASGFLLSGCDGDDGDGHGGSTAAELTSEGWTLFEMGDFVAAESKFKEALAVDAGFAEADNGLGWTWLRLDSLAVAVSSFDAALGKGLASADPYAGQAVAYRDLEPVDLMLAVAAAERALHRDVRFEFAHDPRFDWRDLRLILAQSYFGLQRYAEASAQVDSLGGAAPDPHAERFVEELLAEIERLGEGISGGGVEASRFGAIGAMQEGTSHAPGTVVQ